MSSVDGFCCPLLPCLVSLSFGLGLKLNYKNTFVRRKMIANAKLLTFHDSNDLKLAVTGVEVVNSFLGG